MTSSTAFSGIAAAAAPPAVDRDSGIRRFSAGLFRSQLPNQLTNAFYFLK
jgi:hypothetical protein